MTTFQKIYTIVSNIPKGKVMTYGQVAKLAGTTPRVIGFALHMNKNPKQVPCHRVVGKNGYLTGYAFGGVEKKKEILKNENITLINNNLVDLNKSLYS